MQRRFLLALALLFIAFAPLHAQEPAAQSAVPRGEPNFARWESAIAKIEATSPRDPGGIVFTGSSSIARWKTLSEDFPGLPVRNHGFGGSIVPEVTHFADRIVIPYKPRMVVFYAGDNDLAAGHTPEQVADDFKAFFDKVHKALPKAKIAFISIKPSVLRANLFDEMRGTNNMVKTWLKQQKNAVYIDVFNPMLDAQGKIRPELYVEDKLHMTPQGYEIWKKVVGPYLK
jgi:lysophospholipase L1-like esterase